MSSVLVLILRIFVFLFLLRFIIKLLIKLTRWLKNKLTFAFKPNNYIPSPIPKKLAIVPHTSVNLSNQRHVKGYIDNTQDLHVLILGNVSAGKSTLINALMKEQILPSANAATTANIFKVHSNAQHFSSSFSLISKIDDDTWKNATFEELVGCNKEPVDQVEVKTQFGNVQHFNKNIFLYDTPGPNTATGVGHAEKTSKAVQNTLYTNIIFIFDATNCFTNDDCKLIDDYLLPCQKLNPKSHVLFLLNKIDEVDEDKELSIKEIVRKLKDQLESKGIIHPTIMPIMAKAAAILRKTKTKQALTTKESLYARQMEQRLRELPEFHLLNNSLISGELYSEIKLKKFFSKTPHYWHWLQNKLELIVKLYPAIFRKRIDQYISKTGIRAFEVYLENTIINPLIATGEDDV